MNDIRGDSNCQGLGQGYAEVLLTPGVFLRIGQNREVQLGAAGLLNTGISVIRGSALLEAADVVKRAALDGTVGNSAAQIEGEGLYAFDASSRTVKALFIDRKSFTGSYAAGVRTHRAQRSPRPALPSTQAQGNSLQR